MGALVGSLRYGLAFVLPLLVVGGATASADVFADEGPTLSVEATVVGAEPATAAVFTIKLSAPADSDISMRFSTGAAEGADAATADADYQPATGVLVKLPKGETAVKVAVRVLDDPLDEAREKFLVIVSDASDGRIDPGVKTAIGWIQDNDEPPVAKVANAPDVAEGNSGTSKAVFTVSLSKKSGREARVAFTTRDGTAKAGEDYAAKSGVLRIPAGDLSGTVSVDVLGDTKVENTESFALVIARHDETAVVGAPSEAAVKILNDDQAGVPPPVPATVSIADATGDESSTVSFRVTLSPAVTRPVSVKWATADGTATAGTDYTAGNGTLSFAAGETTKTVAVAILADEQAESSETFLVNLSGPVGATLADAQALGTIVDKGAPPSPPTPPPTSASLSVTDVLARESEGATFTVELTKAVSSRVSVTVSTSDGTAKEGVDYLARRATIEFAPGERTKTIAVTVLDDDLAEPDETFSVGLGNPVNAVITKSRGIATIESNDLAAAVAARPDAIPSGALPVTVKPPTKAGKVQKTLLPRMALWPVRVKVGPRGVARMTVACRRRSPVTCSGLVALVPVAEPRFLLAVETFRVRKGRQAALSLKLGPRGRRLLAREGRVRARVIVQVQVGSVTLRVLPGVITLDTGADAGSSRSRP